MSSGRNSGQWSVVTPYYYIFFRKWLSERIVREHPHVALYLFNTYILHLKLDTREEKQINLNRINYNLKQSTIHMHQINTWT